MTLDFKGPIGDYRVVTGEIGYQFPVLRAQCSGYAGVPQGVFGYQLFRRKGIHGLVFEWRR